MSEITVEYIGVSYMGSEEGEPEPEHAVTIDGYPGPIGEAELYAIKTALERQVQLNAEVEAMRARREVTAAK